MKLEREKLVEVMAIARYNKNPEYNSRGEKREWIELNYELRLYYIAEQEAALDALLEYLPDVPEEIYFYDRERARKAHFYQQLKEMKR